MKPRARRFTIGAAALAAVLLAVLVVAKWSTVRDHVEAWHFQLTRKTEDIPPGTPFLVWAGISLGKVDGVEILDLLDAISNSFAYPIIVDSDLHPALMLGSAPVVGLKVEIGRFRGISWRVLEQRFPRRAYVVIRDERKTIQETKEPTATFPSPGIPLPPILLEKPEQSHPMQELLREESY